MYQRANTVTFLTCLPSGIQGSCFSAPDGKGIDVYTRLLYMFVALSHLLYKPITSNQQMITSNGLFHGTEAVQDATKQVTSKSPSVGKS